MYHYFSFRAMIFHDFCYHILLKIIVAICSFNQINYLLFMFNLR